MNFLLGNGHMLDASGDDDKLAFVQPDVAVAQPDQQPPFDDQE
jgi:hypothetical protein